MTNEKNQLIKDINNMTKLLEISVKYDKANWHRHHELSSIISRFKADLLHLVLQEQDLLEVA